MSRDGSEGHRRPPNIRRIPSVRAHPGAVVVVRSKAVMRSFEAYLFAEREQPVVGVARSLDSDEPAIAAEVLRSVVGPEPRIYYIPNEYMLRRLSYTVGQELCLTVGAARVWWPGLSTRSDPGDHPLVVALESERAAATLEELARSFDLSRPRVRTELKLLEGALALAEHRLSEERSRSAEAAQRARVARQPAPRNPRGAKAGVGRANRAGQDCEESLHGLIVGEWVGALTAGDRRKHPLGYVLSPEFIAMVEQQRDLSRTRTAWVCAMVACGYAPALTGLNPHRLLTGAPGSPQSTREDGAKGWRCNLKRNSASGPRVHYWTLEDGTVEFAAIGNHDDLGRR